MSIQAFAILATGLAAITGAWSLDSSSLRGDDAPVSDPAVAVIAADVALPATLTFDDRMGHAHVARLDAPLEVARPPATDLAAGDVVYVAAERAVVIVHGPVGAVPEGAVVRIGTIADGLAALADCPRGCAVEVAAR